MYLLKTGVELSDLFLVLFLTFKGLFLRKFQGFQVVTNNTKLFFKFDNLAKMGFNACNGDFGNEINVAMCILENLEGIKSRSGYFYESKGFLKWK